MKLVVVSVVLVACGSKEPPPAAPPSNVVITPDAMVSAPPDAATDSVVAVMATMNGFADEMCGCRDKACADKVQEAMTKWSTQMASEAGDRDMRKATEKELEQMTTIGQRYGECMTKAMQP